MCSRQLNAATNDTVYLFVSEDRSTLSRFLRALSRKTMFLQVCHALSKRNVWRVGCRIDFPLGEKAKVSRELVKTVPTTESPPPAIIPREERTNSRDPEDMKNDFIGSAQIRDKHSPRLPYFRFAGGTRMEIVADVLHSKHASQR